MTERPENVPYQPEDNNLSPEQQKAKDQMAARILQRMIEKPAILDEITDRLENDEIVD